MLLCVCVCVRVCACGCGSGIVRVRIFVLIWRYFVQKTHRQMSGARQSFHTELDVFYGNLVNFSLYFFFTYNYIYI